MNGMVVVERSPDLPALVVTRNQGQRVHLRLPDGSTIWVAVKEVSWGRVRLLIQAPPAVRVLREELIYHAPVFRHGPSPREDDGQLE